MMKTIRNISHRRLFVLILLVLSAFSKPRKPRNYSRNPHVGFEVKQERDEYVIWYSFKDHEQRQLDFTIRCPANATDALIDKFGVPESMLGRFVVTEEILKRREEILAYGLFKKENNVIKVDFSAAIRYYAPFCESIAEGMIEVLQQSGKDTRRDRIELAMKFIQDIPYGIPESPDKRIYRGGISPPPEILLNMYGDCDSKAILFVCILSHLIDNEDIIFLHQPDHVLTAIEGDPEAGDTYVRYKGKKYILAETAGPGRFDFGEVDENVRRIEVEELDL